MNNRRAIAGTVILALLMPLAAGMRALTAALAPDTALRLPACEWNQALFPPLEAKELAVVTTTQKWSGTYHQTVRGVIDGVGGGDAELSCTGTPQRLPEPAFGELAANFEPWRSGATVTEGDRTAVLLEYLRAYECTLRQRQSSLADLVGKELAAANALTAPAGTEPGYNLADALKRADEEDRLIRSELMVARRALHRALAAGAGRERLTVLNRSAECLLRSSADINLELGLGAAATSCLAARAWDATSPLLTLPRE